MGINTLVNRIKDAYWELAADGDRRSYFYAQTQEFTPGGITLPPTQQADLQQQAAGMAQQMHQQMMAPPQMPGAAPPGAVPPGMGAPPQQAPAAPPRPSLLDILAARG